MQQRMRRRRSVVSQKLSPILQIVVTVCNIFCGIWYFWTTSCCTLFERCFQVFKNSHRSFWDVFVDSDINIILVVQLLLVSIPQAENSLRFGTGLILEVCLNFVSDKAIKHPRPLIWLTTKCESCTSSVAITAAGLCCHPPEVNGQFFIHFFRHNCSSVTSCTILTKLQKEFVARLRFSF